MSEITRADLRAAVEAGIECQQQQDGPPQGRFTPGEEEALRYVARTAGQFAYATDEVAGVGCPLTQACLGARYTGFWVKFDDLMMQRFGLPPVSDRIVTVTDG